MRHPKEGNSELIQKHENDLENDLQNYYRHLRSKYDCEDCFCLGSAFPVFFILFSLMFLFLYIEFSLILCLLLAVLTIVFLVWFYHKCRMSPESSKFYRIIDGINGFIWIKFVRFAYRVFLHVPRS